MNKKRLRIFNTFYRGNTTGVVSYWNDFEKIVLPEILDKYELTDGACDVAFSFHERVTPKMLKGNAMDKACKIFRILHVQKKTMINQFRYDNTNKIKFVTHYEALHDDFRFNNIDSVYIPMSIDTEKLPKECAKNGKIIYFGNVTTTKINIYQQIKNLVPEINTLSLGLYNRQPIKQEDVFKIVAEHEIGIGVGRCALEMLAMGMKVIVAGRNYSGVISSLPEFYQHWASNCNTNNLVNDVNAVRDDVTRSLKNGFILDRTIVDMRNFTNNYMKALNDLVESE